MKKLLCVLLCFSLCLGVAGCNRAPSVKGLSVVATIFPAYDLARQIGGDTASVTMLLPPGGEVHGYEPSLTDLAAVKNCDVFIYNGGESDGWVETLLANCDTANKTVIRMMDTVELLAVGEEHHQHHHDHHHSHEEADEHVWTAPENARIIADAIGAGMMEQDPEHKEAYQTGLTRLEQQLQALCRSYEVLRRDALPTLVVADRFPFLYLTHAYGLSYVAAFSGCTSNTEASLSAVVTLKNQAEQPGTSRWILCTEFSDGVLAQTVADGVGGRVARLHSCHNVTQEEWNSGVTYVELMNRNLWVLKEVLGL